MILPLDARPIKPSSPVVASSGGLLKFLGRHLSLSEALDNVEDGREPGRVRVPLGAVLRALLAGFLFGLGSVRAVEDRLCHSLAFRRFVGVEDSISDDTLRDATSRLAPAGLQAVLYQTAERELLRWGAGRYLECELARRLKPLGCQGLVSRAVVALDGHETLCSEKVACADCHSRVKTVKRGGQLVKVTEHYHKLVVAHWIGTHPAVVLDFDVIQPGEGEQTAVYRLLRRLEAVYGDKIGTVVADALHDHEPFRSAARAAGFYTVVRHKDARRQPGGELAKALERRDPHRVRPDGRHTDRVSGCSYEYWVEQEPHNGRRYVETRRSGGGKPTTVGGCVTDLPAQRVHPLAVGLIMETRWSIENTCFHELAGQLHLDRAFIHANRPIGAWAIACLAFVAYNAWQSYLYRHLGLDASRPSRTWGDLRRDLWESLQDLLRSTRRRASARAP